MPLKLRKKLLWNFYEPAQRNHHWVLQGLVTNIVTFYKCVEKVQ